MHDLDELLTQVTPAQARDWRVNDNFIGQRDLRTWHGRLLGQLMENETFRSGSKIEFCEFDGKLILIDGQHTLFGIETSGFTQDLLVVKKRSLRWMRSENDTRPLVASWGARPKISTQPLDYRTN